MNGIRVRVQETPASFVEEMPVSIDSHLLKRVLWIYFTVFLDHNHTLLLRLVSEPSLSGYVSHLKAWLLITIRNVPDIAVRLPAIHFLFDTGHPMKRQCCNYRNRRSARISNMGLALSYHRSDRSSRELRRTIEQRRGGGSLCSMRFATSHPCIRTAQVLT